jgi:hypothetical protein
LASNLPTHPERKASARYESNVARLSLWQSRFPLKTGMLESQRFLSRLVEIPASSSGVHSPSGEVGCEGWEGWRAGRSASVHTHTESICDLASTLCALPRAGHGSCHLPELRGCSACVFIFCMYFVRVCRDAHLSRPCRAEGGRTAPMAMPSRYVGIEHVSIRLTAPHARAPLGSWSTRSSHFSEIVETHSSPLRSPLATFARRSKNRSRHHTHAVR